MGMSTMLAAQGSKHEPSSTQCTGPDKITKTCLPLYRGPLIARRLAVMWEAQHDLPWVERKKSFSGKKRGRTARSGGRFACGSFDATATKGAQATTKCLLLERGRCVLHGRGVESGERVRMSIFWAWALSISRSWSCRHCPQDAPQILGIGSGIG